MEKLGGAWANTGHPVSAQFVCGHCGNDIATNVGWECQGARHTPNGAQHGVFGRIYVCHKCNRPTFFELGAGQSLMNQVPGSIVGSSIQHIKSKDVESLYEEMRRCISSSAYTAAVMAARKILMNVAVVEGAESGKTFAHYVDFLVAQGFVPPGAKTWVDEIRKKGNEANHEIALMTKAEAEELQRFVEMLLKFIYEFPGAIAVKAQK